MSSWNEKFESTWGCSIRTEPMPDEISIEPEKVTPCPLCDEPIYHNQNACIKVADDFKVLVHTDCAES